MPHNVLRVVIHFNSVIGKNVCIQHHVLLRQRNRSEETIIEDNVIINPYSMGLGKITIGGKEYYWRRQYCYKRCAGKLYLL